MRLFPALLLMLFATVSIAAGEQPMARLYFGEGPYDPDWQASKGQGCDLSGVIPGYGRAVFRQLPGQQMTFHTEPFSLARVGAAAELISAPPPWMHQRMPQRVSSLYRNRGRETLSMEPGVSYRLLHELSQGMAPVLAYRDHDRGSVKTVLNLSPFQFFPALREFQRCAATIAPFPLNALDLTRVYFSSGSWRLGPRNRVILDNLVEQIDQQDDVAGVVITGHTDNIGNAADNRVLSRKRMLEVSNYLIAAGVSAGQIEERHAGEAQPMVPNQNEANRSRNRRVDILLRREM